MLLSEKMSQIFEIGVNILIKLAREVGLDEIFQKPLWFFVLTFLGEGVGGI